MFGFQRGGAAAAAKKNHIRRGGPIKGPGTGTSDSIDARVPAGSYIMPADSTAQLGAKALDDLGAPVPVKVSDGEYQLSPEEVHAIGVKALENIKNATHQPAARGFKPELFFADGGVVEDERRRQRGQAMRQQQTAPDAMVTDAADQGARLRGAAQRRQAREIRAPTDLFGQGGSGTGGQMARSRVAIDAPAPASVGPSTRPRIGSELNPRPELTAGASPAAVPTHSAVDASAPTIRDTGVAGIKRVNGIAGAPNMFTDNPDRAIADAGIARGFNPAAARQARDGRLNSGTTSVPAIAAGLQPQGSQDYRVRGLGGQYESAAESGYRPGGIVIGDSTGLDPRGLGFDRLAYQTAKHEREAAHRSRELSQRGAADRQGFELQREELAERRAERAADFDPNRSRLTAAQAGLAETQASQAQHVRQLTEQMATATDPARRAQLQEALLVAQGKTGSERRTRPLRIQVPTGQMNLDGEPITQDAIYDPDTGQTTIPGVEGAPQAAAGAGAPADSPQFESGAVYTDSQGRRARWDGNKFVPA